MNRIHSGILSALCALCLFSTSAYATDFKVSGTYDVTMQRMEDITFLKGTPTSSEYNFAVGQLITVNFDAIVSEYVSATLSIDIGTTTWGVAGVVGSRSQGGDLGTAGIPLKAEEAYLNFTIPDTKAKVAMGIQSFVMPATSLGSAIFNDNVPAITVNIPINDKISTQIFWMRPFAFGYGSPLIDGDTNYGSSDFFGVILPISYDKFSITPWAMYGRMGKGVIDGYMNNLNNLGNLYPPLPSWSTMNVYGYTGYLDGLLPVILPVNAAGQYESDSGNAWWLGLTGQVTPTSEITLSLDANYGSTGLKNGWNRKGWYTALMGEYSFHWGTPGIYGWYASGDDNKLHNGSERLPGPSPLWGNTELGFSGQFSLSYGNAISISPAGTWGLALQVNNLSFIDKLSHTIILAYYRGTNNTAMAKYLTGELPIPGYSSLYGGGNAAGVTPFIYLTTKDAALELNFSSTYNIYKELQANLAFAYIWQDFDSKVWSTTGQPVKFKNAWNIALNLQYSF